MDLFEYAEKLSQTDQAKPVTQAVWTVSRLTTEIKTLLLSQFGKGVFWVRGEVSNFRGRNQSGHMYFRLKDAGAIVSCVFFRGANSRLGFELKDGDEIIVCGRLDLWERGGSYQLVVEEVSHAGAGELFLKFEQLKQKLQAQGLFSDAHKKQLPSFPRRIGVVTSPTGAALRDMIHVLSKRNPWVTLLLYPVRVQGVGAAEEIARAIDDLNKHPWGVDLIIIGRGGGSIEDLWAFNEEVVAQAIYQSDLPIVSAVGHQTDFTISDFVADVRAATPSQAVEIVVPNLGEIARNVRQWVSSVLREARHASEKMSNRLSAVQLSPFLRDPHQFFRARAQDVDVHIETLSDHMTQRIDRGRDRVIALTRALRLLLGQTMEPYRMKYGHQVASLHLLSPLAVLSRGYSIATDRQGAVIRQSGQMALGDLVLLRLSEGGLECKVEKVLKP